MAHFAQIDENNFVTQVIVVHNNECTDENGDESEATGVAFCKSLFGPDTRWKQTSYNGNIRKNYAGIGYYFDGMRDAFVPPRPFPSWSLDEATCRWNAPTPMPTDGKMYQWDEDTLSWTEVVSA